MTSAYVSSTPHRVAIRPDVDVSVIIGTYGDDHWDHRGDRLAQRTFEEQTPVYMEVINVHASTLANARNHGANLSRGQWLVFLDADDFLDSSFCLAVAQSGASVDVLCPKVQGFRADGEMIEDESVRPTPTDLIKQNYLPVGAPIRCEMFERVGGFKEWPVLEDWAFWLEAEYCGATFGELDSTYYINDDHLRSKHPESNRIAREIRAQYR